METVCAPNPATSKAVGLMESHGYRVLNSCKFQKQILLSIFTSFLFFHKFCQVLATSCEHQNIRKPEHHNIRTSEHQNIRNTRTSEHQNIRKPENQNTITSETPEHQNTRTSENQNTITSENQNTISSEHQNIRTP